MVFQENFTEAWKAITKTRLQQRLPQVVQVCISFCIIYNSFIGTFQENICRLESETLESPSLSEKAYKMVKKSVF